MSQLVLSRRSFLKAIGVTTLAATASNVDIPRAVYAAAVADCEDYTRALSAAEKSLDLQQVTSELLSQGFAFDLSQSSFLRNEKMPPIVGLTLKATTQANAAVTDLILTVDLQEQRLTYINLVVGQNGTEKVTITNTLLDATNQTRTREQKHYSFAQLAELAALGTTQATQPQTETKSQAGHIGDRFETQSCTPTSWRECGNYSYTGCCATAACCKDGRILYYACRCSQYCRTCRWHTINSNCVQTTYNWYNDCYIVYYFPCSGGTTQC